ncbi:ATP-binding protein [Actinophytocola sp.]|uniref:ATP-binding protein n=1 Tax=Actinophytocola sp. TaxID=1872138 RepID=UPI002D7E39A1|nr:tetratricopeptide repeat protein [Actinophytocola sp.]HET9139718.1 tetratricopeptide repeat protein [Actinophytocola sp.]
MPEETDHQPRSAAEQLATALRTVLRQAERGGAPIKKNALARKLHLSLSSLYAYLDGTTLPSRDVLDRLLHELGVTGAELGRIADLRDEAEDSRRTRRKRAAPQPAPSQPAPPPAAPPCQLPPDIHPFIGRTEQLAELTARLDGGEPTTAPVVVAVCGTAGVGKTALVVRWAHQVRSRFPDGLLYVDLRGFDPEQPREPAEVLGGFLRGLGVASDSIPHDLAELAARFRSELDGKRILLFLDNASSEQQVRPLLPNSAHCFVLVTSRHRLPGLVARDGAHRIDVPSLPVDDAIALMSVLVGEPRVRADEQGAAALVERCARLPLTIRIGADLATTRKRSPLKELADELHRYHLDLFQVGGDERTAVRAVFSWSYLHLRADRARAFRLLGLHPGQDTDAAAGAALLGVPALEAQQLIDDLVRASLLEEAGDRRYRMHDLLRAYAREQVTDEDERRRALRALFDYYLGTAAAAMDLIAPHDRNERAGLPAPAASVELTGPEHAVSWLDAERHNLLTIAEFGASQGWPNVTIFTSSVLSRYLDARGYYSDAATLHALTLAIARDAGAAALEAQELHRIGIIHMRLGHHAQAQAHLEQALAVGREVGDRALAGRSLHYLGLVSLRLGHNEKALEYFDAALPVVRETGNDDLTGHVLSGLGFAHCQLGRYPMALMFHKQALRIARQLGNKELAGHVLNSLGLVYQRVGDTDRASRCHRQTWRIAQRTGNRGLEADSLKSLGAVRLSQGDVGAAIRLLDRSLAIAVGIGQCDIEGYVRRTLGRAHGLAGSPELAKRHLRQALQIARNTGNRELEAETLNEAGAVLLPGDARAAVDHYARALVIARDSANRWQEMQSLDGLADAHLALHQSAVAHDLRGQANAVRTAIHSA